MEKIRKEDVRWETWDEIEKEWMKDPEFKKEYDKLGPEYELISKVIGARIKKGLTQAELAKKIGTKQSAIARLESGNANPSFNFLKKVGTGLGKRLQIDFK